LEQFSAKMFKTIFTSVKLIIGTQYATKVKIIFRQQIQPWHPSSILVHEAGTAVLKIAPTKFWEFSNVLFKKQKEFFDVNVVNESRNQTYSRLTELASAVGIDRDQVYNLLVVDDKAGADGSLNIGNRVTDDIKLMVKANRLTGVHVTPTVLFNGVEEKTISSSFTAQQWEDWLSKNAT